MADDERGKDLSDPRSWLVPEDGAEDEREAAEPGLFDDDQDHRP